MIYIFFSLLSFSLLASVESADYLCDSSNKGNAITSPLEKDGKDKMCIMGTCVSGKERIDRELCLRQISEDTFSLNQRDFYKKENSSGVSGKALRRFVLHPGEACFEECRPENKKKLGIDKKECVRCLFKQPKSEADFIEIKGHGVTLQKGQKCYYPCKLQGGGYKNGSPYSEKCLECIRPEIKSNTYYLIDSYGKCFEFIEGEFNKVYGVPVKLCHEASEVYGTVFKKGSSYDIKVMLFGKKPACLEIDDFSFGGYLSRETLDWKCDSPSVNSDERTKVKETGGSRSSKKTSSKANKQ